ncbi:MAG: dethiobiotin synthase [Candidatus Binatia bacterium]
MQCTILVTGTDTGIGKTAVTCAIAAALDLRGLDVGVMKPVETGCAPDATGARHPPDAGHLRWFAGRADPLDTVCPYPLRDPLAPALAARREGIPLDIDRIAAHVQRLRATCAIGLIEGAGGLLAPFAVRATLADLAAACALPLLIVVGNRLGCVNHAAMTVRCAEAAGLRIAGYVVNTLTAEPDLATETNVDLLAETIGPSLGVMPWLGHIECTEADRRRLAAAAERALDLDRLLATARNP